jgi:hypothetical protein
VKCSIEHSQKFIKIHQHISPSCHNIKAVKDCFHKCCRNSSCFVIYLTAQTGLPAFLVKDGGLNSGFMLAHCTAAALGMYFERGWNLYQFLHGWSQVSQTGTLLVYSQSQFLGLYSKFYNSKDSSAGIITRLLAGWPGCHGSLPIRGSLKRLELIKTPIQWMPGINNMVLRQPSHKANRSPLSCCNVKKA